MIEPSLGVGARSDRALAVGVRNNRAMAVGSGVIKPWL